MRTVLRVITAMLLALLAVGSVAETPGQQLLGGDMEWVADTDAQLRTIEQLEAMQERLEWQRVSGSGLNAGFTTTPHWFRFEVAPIEPDVSPIRYLHIPEALLNEVDVYVHHDTELIAHHTMGAGYPFDQRPIAHREFVVPVTLSTEAPTRFHLRVRTEGSLQVEPILWEPSAFAERTRVESIASGLFYGIMLVMVVYNLFVYFLIRSTSYLYYIAFVTVFTLFMGALHGDAFQFLWPEAVSWNETSVTFLVAFMGITALAFTDSFLQLRRRWPLMHQVMMGLMVVSVVATVLSLLLAYSISIRISALHGLVIMATILFTGSAMLVQGHRYARYFVMAWLALLLGTSALALSKWGLLPWNAITANGAQIGAVLEVVLLSFALGDRINYERATRFEAQRQALEAAEEAKSAQRELIEAKESANRELENRVRERTRKLEETLTELERMNQYLESLSNTDQLTNLNNRHCFVRTFHDEYRRAHRQQYPVCVIMLDIDHFKWFNDTFGHVAGDECLKAVAEALSGEITRSGDLLARYGGEEFIVLLNNTEADGGEIVAERLREAVTRIELAFEGRQAAVTISLGVADSIPQDLDDPESLIQCADEALYNAKDQGRNRVCRYSREPPTS